MRLSEADHVKVTAAVTAAEAGTDGEIVAVVARSSDAYHDVALQWSVLGLLASLVLLAAAPGVIRLGPEQRRELLARVGPAVRREHGEHRDRLARVHLERPPVHEDDRRPEQPDVEERSVRHGSHRP